MGVHGSTSSTTLWKIAFGIPFDKEDDFDPLLDSVYGATAESSHKREASAPSSEPMKNPYEQSSKRRGRSQEREEPQDSWEQPRSSSGSSEPPQDDPFQDDLQQDAQDNQQEEPSANVQDDPIFGRQKIHQMMMMIL